MNLRDQFKIVKLFSKLGEKQRIVSFFDIQVMTLFLFSSSEMVQDIEEEHKNHDHGSDNRDSSSGPTVVVDVQTEENNNGTS